MAELYRARVVVTAVDGELEKGPWVEYDTLDGLRPALNESAAMLLRDKAGEMQGEAQKMDDEGAWP